MTRTASTTAPKAVANPNKPCGCGACAEFTRGTYAPGHDARHVGLIAREVVRTGDMDLIKHLPSAALQAKATAMATRLAEAKPSKSVKAVATATKPVQPVKVGRWTYPAMIKDGALLRNTKRDGSGEWIAA